MCCIKILQFFFGCFVLLCFLKRGGLYSAPAEISELPSLDKHLVGVLIIFHLFYIQPLFLLPLVFPFPPRTSLLSPPHPSSSIQERAGLPCESTKHEYQVKVETSSSLCIKTEQGIPAWGIGSKNPVHAPETGTDPIAMGPTNRCIYNCHPHAEGRG